MKMIHLNGKNVVFFCDRCGKRLDDQDPGEAWWEDYDNFLATIGTEDEEETKFLCRECLATVDPSRQSSPTEQEPPPSLQELLTHIEQETGLRFIAYDPKEDTIVYGGDLIDELVEASET